MANLYLKSGAIRETTGFFAARDTTDANSHIGINSAAWNNTGDEVTSITIITTQTVTGTIRVYKFKRVALPSSSSSATTFLELTDTPTTYSGTEGLFAQSTGSGIQWAEVQAAGDYLTEEEFTVYSGTLQTQIDGKADTVHTHDDRYYTKSQVDTISDALDASKADVNHTHDDRYYTEDEIDAMLEFIEYTPPTEPTGGWVSYLGSGGPGGANDHWSINNGNWDGTKFNLVGPGITLNVTGSWYEGLRPTKIRITGSIFWAGGSLQVYQYNDDMIASEVVGSGEEVLFSLSTDLDRVDAYAFQTITELELYTEGSSGTEASLLFLSDTTFSSTVTASTPTNASHLTTKNYVDTISGSLQTLVSSKAGTTHSHNYFLFPWALTSNYAYSGDIVVAPAGESISFGDICYLKSDGSFWKTNASVESTSKGMLSMATESISVSGTFLLRGIIRNDSWSWTTGSELWLSETTGELSDTQPTGPGEIVRLIGYAKDSNHVWFDPDKTYIELSYSGTPKVMGSDFSTSSGTTTTSGSAIPFYWAIEEPETDGDGIVPTGWVSTCSDDFDYGVDVYTIYINIDSSTENLPVEKTVYHNQSVSGDFNIMWYISDISFSYEDPGYLSYLGVGVSSVPGVFNSGSYAVLGWSLYDEDSQDTERIMLRTSAGTTTDTDFEETDGYFRLSRTGSTITGYYSPYGEEWTEIGSQSVTSSDVYVGVVSYYGGTVCSGNQYVMAEEMLIGQGTTVIDEDFTGVSGTLPTNWRVLDSEDPGLEMHIRDNKLYMYSHNDVGSTSFYYGSLLAPYAMGGDFDIMVDCDSVFIDPTEPATAHASASVDFGLALTVDPYTIPVNLKIGSSYTDGYSVSYVSDIDGTEEIVTASGVVNAKLRITRVGSLISTYYWDADSWTEIDEGDLGYTPLVSPYFEVLTRGSSEESATAYCSFDNFRSAD
jgi:hypothetical protein